MFWATLCSSSEGQIVLTQHLVLCKWPSGVQVVKNLHTGQSLTDNNIPDAVLIQSDLLMMSTELLKTCKKDDYNNKLII